MGSANGALYTSLSAAVWGQVIEKHAGLIWARELQGELALIAPGLGRFAIYPRIRVCEGQNIKSFRSQPTVQNRSRTLEMEGQRPGTISAWVGATAQAQDDCSR